MQHNARNDTKKIGIQTKLKVSQPGDVYEQEADNVAEHVMRMYMSDSGTSVITTKKEEIDRKYSAREKKNEEEEKMDISRKPSTSSSFETSNETTNMISNISSDGGLSLDNNTQGFMESRFGCDFSKVRVHKDAKASESAQSVNALAYTVGNDIVFGSGQFSPGTAIGRKMLAQELTHVLQQRSNDAPGLTPGTLMIARQKGPPLHSAVSSRAPPVVLQPGPTFWAAAIVARRSAILGEIPDTWQIVDEYKGDLGLPTFTQAMGLRDFEDFNAGNSLSMVKYSISDAGGRTVLQKEGLKLLGVTGADITNHFLWEHLGGIGGLYRPFLLIGLAGQGMAHVVIVFGINKDTILSMDPTRGYITTLISKLNPSQRFLVAS